MQGTVALIPARRNSKRILRKNLVQYRGKPLIQHSVEAALGANSVNHVVVSSDDTEILTLSEGLGVSMLRKRPDSLATDTATMHEVVLDALKWLERAYAFSPSVFLVLQPTSPNRDARIVDDFVNYFLKGSWSVAVSVHACSEHPMESVLIHDEENGLWNYAMEPLKLRGVSQVYPPAYFINGAIYGFKSPYTFSDGGLFSANQSIGFFKMPASRGLDVDDPDDLLR